MTTPEPYRSPHALPVCNDPRTADKYPALHADHDKCPMHSLSGPGENLSKWRGWYRAREKYATAENTDDLDLYLEQMLSRVTSDVPPAYKPLPVPRSRRNVSAIQVTLGIMVIVLILMMCAIAVI